MSRDAVITAALELHKAGRLMEADRFYRGLLSIDPQDADALHLSGLVAHLSGDPAQAASLIARALASNDNAVFHFSHGAALSSLGQHAAAAAAYERALALGHDRPQTHDGIAAACVGLQRWDAAEAAARRALPENPDPGSAEQRLGYVLWNQGRIEDAADAFEQSLAARPGHAVTLIWHGAVLRPLGRYEESLAALQCAIAHEPSNGYAHSNLALTLDDLARPTEALAAIDEALRLDPATPAHRYTRAHILLRAGRYPEAWPGYEARIDPADDTYARYDHIPRWHGEPLEGRTLLLTHEQGFGDTIQFARYAQLLAANGGKVLLDTQPPLRRLLASLAGPARLSTPIDRPDLYCPLLSLPGILGTTLENIPAFVPYLQPQPEAAERWAARLRTPGPRPHVRVGLVWAGNPQHPNDRLRSIPFAQLAPVLDIPGLRWFGLQVGPRAADAAEHPKIQDLSPDLTDLAETAAAMAALDLVITVDTSAAHLAGALARPTWLLLPFAADWRWLTTRETTPWYPTLRLFRQDNTRTWPPVIDRVAHELRRLAVP